MRIYRYLLALAICSSSVGLAVAGVIERDLLEAGDGLLTYDDVNHREWLDMPETSQMPLKEVLLNLAPGGPWEGFQFATREDVRQLADSLQAPWQTGWSMGIRYSDPHEGNNLMELLGWTVRFEGSILGTVTYSSGYVLTSNTNGPHGFDGTTVTIPGGAENSPELIPGAINRFIFPAREIGVPFIESDSPITLRDGTVFSAYWIFREAVVVPEPTTLCLMFTGSLIALRLRAFA